MICPVCKQEITTQDALAGRVLDVEGEPMHVDCADPEDFMAAGDFDPAESYPLGDY